MTVRISALLCGLALLLAVAIGAGTVGYWLAGDPVEAQGEAWQVLKISGQGDPVETLKSSLEKFSVNCMIDFEFNYGENDTYDMYFAWACP
jgi:hypothetical protein